MIIQFEKDDLKYLNNNGGLNFLHLIPEFLYKC